MARPIKPIKDSTLKNWLSSNFKSKSTRNVYTSAMRAFKEALQIDDLGEYLQDNPDVKVDLQKFLSSLDGRPSMTISSYVSAVRVFLQDHNIELNGNGWKKLRRRGFMPKRIRAQTRDKKPTKSQLKKIISYCSDIKARALFLFLPSSGCRIGETLKLEIADFDLEADPPRAFIRGENTKSGVGERTVYFSYEARDAIKNWLAVKESTMRRDGKGSYENSLMFPFSHATALIMWNNACSKAGLDQKDRRTGRRIYHIHSLRKFFRTKIGLDLDVTHALMGHTEYLDAAYLRQDGEEIAKAYLEAMGNVSVYGVENQELKQETEQQKVEIETLKNDLTSLRNKFEGLGRIRDTSDLLMREILQDPRFEKLLAEKVSEGLEIREDGPEGVKIHRITEAE